MTAFIALGFCLLAEPIPKAEREGTILLVKTWPTPVELILMKSGGQVVKRIKPKGIDGQIIRVRINPACTKAFLLCERPDQAVRGGVRFWPPRNGYIVDLEKPEEQAKVVFERLTSASVAAWAPDGKSVYFSDVAFEDAKAAGANDVLPFRSWRLTLDTGTTDPLKLPAGHLIYDLSHDGKTLLTVKAPQVFVNEADLTKARGYFVPMNTLVPKLIIDSEFTPSRISPDGTQAVGYRWYVKVGNPPDRTDIRLLSVDFSTQKETIIREPAEAITMHMTPVWTHGGKRNAFLWSEHLNPTNGSRRSFRANLTVSDPTGRDAKVLFRGEPEEMITVFDWR